MRLWHYKLISYLPRPQLSGQHRECCAMRGKGWGKKHSVVNYVWEYNYYTLFRYHEKIMNEMHKRGCNVNEIWYDSLYRGKKIGWVQVNWTPNCHIPNEQYLKECLDNLKGKGIDLYNKFNE